MLRRTVGQRFIFAPPRKALFILGIASILSSSQVSAQINVVYNQFFVNPYVYNPAYAGVEGHSVFFASYRQQWLNIQDAPAISNVNFHTPLKGGVGLGIMAFNESVGPLNTTWGKISTSYLLTLDRTHYLRFGMSLGGGTNSVNLGEVDSPTDPAFLNIAPNNSFLIGDFGMTYHTGHFNFGVSIPNLMTYKTFSTESMGPVEIKPLDNILFKVNYRGHLGDDIAVEPHVIYRYSDVGPDLYEGTVIFHIKHVLWAGATYRQDNNIIGLIGFKIAESFALGYSYEVGNSDITNITDFTGSNSLLGPTHEVVVGWHLGKRKKHAQHASSFIKSHRLSAEERAKQAELEREKKLAALRDSRPEGVDGDEDALSIIPVGVTVDQPDVVRVNDYGEREKPLIASVALSDGPRDVVTWVPADTPNEVWSLSATGQYRERTAMDGSKEVALMLTRTVDGEAQEVVKWQIIDYDQVIPQPGEEPATPVVADVTPVEDPPTQVEEPATEYATRGRPQIEELDDEQRIVPAGTNLLELASGSYVIAGSFQVFENAERFSDQLFERGFRDAKVGYVASRGYYYVIMFEFEDAQAAQRARNRVRQRQGFEQVWVLNVNN